MSIYQLLRYSVAFLIDSISNGYTLIIIHELKPWVFFALKVYLFEPLEMDDEDIRQRPQTQHLDGAHLTSLTVRTQPGVVSTKLQANQQEE